MTLCADCNHMNQVGVLICESCGADIYDSLLEQVATKKLQSMQTRELSFIEQTLRPIVFYISDYDNPMAITRDREFIVGRSDTKQQDLEVQIDLARYDAQERGVSRQHLILDAQATLPTVRDLGSYNGSFINGQKLQPNVAYPLHSGDELRLGRLTVRVYYK